MLWCADNTIYSGYTTDLTAREAAHNRGTGAKYTRSRTPVRIVYYETFPSKSEAMKRERELKKLTHRQKEELIYRFLKTGEEKSNSG